MTKYLDAIVGHPRGFAENTAARLVADPEAVSTLSGALGGGGGASGLSIATAHISSAQILAMHTTPPILVPAPASGKYVAPLGFLFRFNFVTTAYTPPLDKTLYISTDAEIHSDNEGFWASFVWQTSSFLAQPFTNVRWLGNLGEPNNVDDVIPANVDGDALRLFPGGSSYSDPYTDGDCTVDVTTLYTLLDV